MIIEFLQLVEQEYGGMRVHVYKDQTESYDFRRGQAFMNALRGTPYYDALVGTRKDPFFMDNLGAVYDAIDWLTTK